MLNTVRKLVEGTPVEPAALWVYTRFWQSPSARYDRQAMAVMRRVLRPDSNCVDVGAHRGTVLREILAVAPEGHHYAIEPLPGMAEKLRRRFPGVTVFEGAASDEAGETSFHHVTADPGISGMRPTVLVTPAMAVETLTVKTARLDELVAPAHKINLVKVDVEGAELLVFRGARALLARDRPFIVFECGAGTADRYAADAAGQTFGLLEELGYAVSLMKRWLKDEPPFSVSEFQRQFSEGTNFYFLAYPRPT